MPGSGSAQQWKGEIAPFEKPSHWRSLWQMINSIVPFFVLWYLAYLSLSVSFWITLPIVILAAGFAVRIFIIFHDCGHHSFFRSRRMNEIVGVCVGVLVAFPYHKWKYEHSVHHGTSSNLDRRGTGDVWTLTVDEYLALSPARRLRYRLYRNPLVMFGLGPADLFLFGYRLNRKGAGSRERFGTHLTTIAFAAIIATLCFALGWFKVLLVEGSILYISGAIGIWLFYVQHQFEDTYFEKGPDWDYVSAALQGSSFYRLPKLLQWMTGNIGFHHIHHLGPRVPNYNLQRLHESTPSLQNVPSVGLLVSLKSLRYRLWDEESKRFVRFKDVMRVKSYQ